ncbi:MAG: hypothetical protein IGS50_03530 [Synechococcales cyanobacterium C42_A2020_086]|nr:hypothetical protein [Synechococcales cyanobacterium C42_A2020_086]
MNHAGTVRVVVWHRQLLRHLYLLGRRLLGMLLSLLLPLGVGLAAVLESAQSMRSHAPMLDLMPVANLLDAVPPPRSSAMPPHPSESDRRGPTEQISGDWQPPVFPFVYSPEEQPSTIIPGSWFDGLLAAEAPSWSTLLPGYHPCHFLSLSNY